MKKITTSEEAYKWIEDQRRAGRLRGTALAKALYRASLLEQKEQKKKLEDFVDEEIDNVLNPASYFGSDLDF